MRFPRPIDRLTAAARAHWPLLLAVVLATVAFARGLEPRGPTARLDADAYYYYLPLASLAADGDLDFTNEYAAHGNWYGFERTKAGRPGNVFGVGPAVFSAPLFLAGRAIAAATGAPRDGFSRPEVWLTLYASVLASAGGAFFAARLARRRLGARAWPVAITLLVLVSGPVYYYAVRQPGYAHPFGTLFAAWLVDAWDRGRDGDAPRGWRDWLTLGALYGATVLARPQLATWVVVPLAALVEDLARAPSRRRVLGHALLGGVVAAVVFSPQALAWRAIYGSALVIPQGSGFMRWSEPAIAEVLFSSRNGLLAWAPLYAVALVGLALAVRRDGVARVLLVALLLQIVVNGAAWDFWGGGAFGGRRFCSTYVAFAYGLAALFVRLRGEGSFDPVRIRDQALVLPALAIGLGTLALAQTYGVSTARIGGGAAPSVVMRERLPLRVAAAPAIASDVVLFAPRAIFALRYGAPLDAWDKVVGVHFLDELHPGLNVVTAPHDRAVVAFHGAPPPFAVGFSAAADGLRVAPAGSGRLLLPLNERRPRMRISLDADGPLALRFDGQAVSLEAGALPSATVAIHRGVNVLEVTAPSSPVTLRALTLEARP